MPFSKHNMHVFNKLFHNLWKTCGKTEENKWERIGKPFDFNNCIWKNGKTAYEIHSFPFYSAGSFPKDFHRACLFPAF